MDGIEPVGNIAQVWIEFVTINLPIGNLCMRKTIRKIVLDHDVCIPKSGMMCADVANNCDASQPIAHIFKFWNHKTAAYSFLCGIVTHVAVKFRECTH